MPEAATEDDVDRIIRQCTVKAEAKAVQGQSVVGVAAVFRAKGVPADRAHAEAERIVAEAGSSIRRRKHLIIGFVLIAIGIEGVLYVLFDQGGWLALVPGILVIFGIRFLLKR